MSSESNTSVEIARMVLTFLSDNMIYLLFFTLLIVCRKAISDFICRATKFIWKKGDSEIGLVAVPPHENVSVSHFSVGAIESPEKSEEDQRVSPQEDIKGQDWFFRVHECFKEGRIDEAASLFDEYAYGEKDQKRLYENKAIFLYYSFKDGKSDNAISQLESLADSIVDEETKLTVLIWLSFCFRDSSEINKEIDLWRKSLLWFKSSDYISTATVSLATALNEDDSSNESKKLLVERMCQVSSDKEKHQIYSCLSNTEKKLGNELLSIYCKDKSLEYDPNNRDDLFSSAYQASQEHVNELSISNYVKLLRIDQDNSLALNNLGVCARDADLDIKAVEKYKKSAQHDETLAMSNQGYGLLNAGFVEEAETIAQKALKIENPDQSVYSLLGQIAKNQKEENTKWQELINASMERQKFIRKYTEAYYLGTVDGFDCKWATEDNSPVNVSILDDALNIGWREASNALSPAYIVEISGKIVNSTFKGQYKRNQEGEQKPMGLLGINLSKNIACVGHLSEDGTEFSILAEDYKDKFSLILRAVNG